MVRKYTADTHAFAYYLADKLPESADLIFREAERGLCTIFLPSIAVVELIYVFEATRSENKIWKMFEKINLTPSFSIYPLDESVLRKLPDTHIPELHDRIIVATSLLLEVNAVVTKDRQIKKSRMVKTIW